MSDRESEITQPSAQFSMSHSAYSKTGEPGGKSVGKRMVLPYQVWMLQRIEDTISALPEEKLKDVLGTKEIEESLCNGPDSIQKFWLEFRLAKTTSVLV